MTSNHTIEVACHRCMLCGKKGTVSMPYQAYVNWQAGAHIQNAWPEGTAADREMLISGTHSACWDNEFKDDDE